MKNLFYLLLVVALASCGGAKNDKTQENTSDVAEVPAVVEVSVDSLIADGAAYEGKTVKFSGLVNHVCRHSGTKLTINGTKPDTYLKVMATDEFKTFDAELTGANVEVVGVVASIQSENVEECSSSNNAEVAMDGKVYVVNCKSVVKL